MHWRAGVRINLTLTCNSLSVLSQHGWTVLGKEIKRENCTCFGWASTNKVGKWRTELLVWSLGDCDDVDGGVSFGVLWVDGKGCWLRVLIWSSFLDYMWIMDSALCTFRQWNTCHGMKSNDRFLLTMVKYTYLSYFPRPPVLIGPQNDKTISYFSSLPKVTIPWMPSGH